MNSSPVVVMGMGPSGLFLVRQLHNITNNIYAIGRSDDVGMFSKFIKKEKRYYAQTEDTVYTALKSIAEIEATKPAVYLCSDQYLTMLVNAVHDWSEVCDFPGTNLETLKQINNKAWINIFCEENGICIPETVDMASFCLQPDQHFPIIIKWKEKKLEAKSNPIGKVYVCKTKDQFESLLSELKTSWVSPEALLVQTFIEGNNNYQYSVGGFYKNGIPLAHVTVKQAKQFPQGISAQVFTIKDNISVRTEQIAFDLAKRFDFSGFLETEFKIDEKTGDVYLLDVNPRPWGWVSILGAAYPDFYRVLDGVRPKQEMQNAIWSSPIRKVLSAKNPNNVDVAKRVLKYRKALDINDMDDRVPGIMIFVMAIIKKFKR